MNTSLAYNGEIWLYLVVKSRTVVTKLPRSMYSISISIEEHAPPNFVWQKGLEIKLIFRTLYFRTIKVGYVSMSQS